MQKRTFSLLAGFFLLFTACNNNASEEKTVTDTVTVTKTDTVVTEAAAPVVDTAAILAFYEAQHAKKKSPPHKHAPKKVADKEVTIDADPIFVAVDAMPVIQTSATATPAPVEKEVVVVHDVEMYYFIPDESASFPGGEKAFDKYLSEHIEYPEKASSAFMSHTVYATAFMDADGRIQKIDFKNKPTGYGFQDEARRVLLNSPRWNPAKQAGKAVKSKFTIPIHFEVK